MARGATLTRMTTNPVIASSSMVQGTPLAGMTTNPVIASGGAFCRSERTTCVRAIPTYARGGDYHREASRRSHGPNDRPRSDRIDVIRSGGAFCRSERTTCVRAIPTYDRGGDCFDPNDGSRSDRIGVMSRRSAPLELEGQSTCHCENGLHPLPESYPSSSALRSARSGYQGLVQRNRLPLLLCQAGLP